MPKKNKIKKIKKAVKKAREVRRHFKVSLERISIHLGKIVDKSSVKDISDVLLNAVLAYASYQHFTVIDQNGNVHRNPMNAMFGPIALKLAQTDGLISQGAGVAGLITLGACMGGVQLGELPDLSSWEAFQKIEKERSRKGRYVVRI